jgi:adenylyltransferase/sulfurtransferase
MQALEVIKYLVGVGANIKNRLLVWDGGQAECTVFAVRRDPHCPTCGTGRTRTQAQKAFEAVHA